MEYARERGVLKIRETWDWFCVLVNLKAMTSDSDGCDTSTRIDVNMNFVLVVLLCTRGAIKVRHSTKKCSTVGYVPCDSWSYGVEARTVEMFRRRGLCIAHASNDRRPHGNVARERRHE